MYRDKIFTGKPETTKPLGKQNKFHSITCPEDPEGD
jgi:hypothetical protein